MNKDIKGFTLTELLAVILILAIISSIALPSVTNSIKKSKQDAYNEQILLLKKSTKDYVLENLMLFYDEGIYTINLSTLKIAGLVDNDIRNPKTGNYLDDLMPIQISFSDNQYSYLIGACDGIIDCLIDNKSDDKNISYNYVPSIILNGSAIEYYEVNSSCNNECTITYSGTNTSDGGTTPDPKYEKYVCTNDLCTWQESTINIKELATYRITYEYSSELTGKSAVPLIKTVIIRDTTRPNITFDANTEVLISEFENFDLTNSVVITDNSTENIDVDSAISTGSLTITSNLSKLPGDYNITYTYEDSSGNVISKNRTVKVVE